MQYTTLGKTGIRVSRLCLGTMTFGEQTSPDDAHRQMSYATDHAINFFDTAELYAIPPKAETYGRTEEIIGDWFTASGQRDKVVLASKIAGPAGHLPWIRGGSTRHDRANIDAALDASLQRLKTDYIDLYQIHWPLRPVNSFGKLGYDQNTITGRESDAIAETLTIFKEKIRDGKIRHIGLSNETPWGVMTFLRFAEELNLPRIVSIQNPYSLLNRSFEVGLAEMAMQEKTGLLAYAPLGAGTLTGKYLNGQVPKGSRWDIDSRPSRYKKTKTDEAVTAYIDIAKKHGLNHIQMAIAFVQQQAFTTSVILGASQFDQLPECMGAENITLSPDVIADINAVHAVLSNPCP